MLKISRKQLEEEPAYVYVAIFLTIMIIGIFGMIYAFVF